MAINTLGFDQSEFEELVREHQSFVITTHVNPDGDAIGSEVGLGEWLASLGKTVRIINHSPTPYNYEFLAAGDPPIQQFSESEHDAVLRESDVFFILDVNDPDRVRSLAPYAREHANLVAVIDHHLEPKEFAGHYFIDTDACSTAEMVYRLVKPALVTVGGKITERGAQALYTGFMTDTGHFKFPRTDSEVFRMCADLLDQGADPVRAHEEVYNTGPASKLLLLRDSLNSLEYLHNDRMAIQLVTQHQLKSLGADEEQVDGFVQLPFQVKGIVLSVFILELREGWKLSVRSKGNVSAASIAQRFGGNGHFHAAGARIHEKLSSDELIQRVAEAGKAVLDASTNAPL